MKKDTTSFLIIIIFVLTLTLPFSNKAVHMDDTIFIYIADQIANDPLRPYSFHAEWGGYSGPGNRLVDTPLIPYYIALIRWIIGSSEIALHLSFIIFPLVAGLSFYFIAKKFIKWALISTLIMLATPTFLVNSHNLMLDVPMISLFLLSVALFVYGVDTENKKLLFSGGIVGGFAYMAKPNAIILIPILILYCLIKKKPKYTAYQLIPAMFIILFLLHNYFFDERIFLQIFLQDYLPLLIRNKISSFKILGAYFFSNLSYIGGATIFPLFFLFPFLLRKRNFIFFILSAIISAVISAALYNASSNFVSGNYTLLQILLFFIFITISIFFIILIFAENYSNIKMAMQNILKSKKVNYDVDMVFIFLWLMGTFILNSGISGGTVRYNTLFLPPFLISYFILLKKYKEQFKLNIFKLSVFILVLTAFVGFLVAYADYDYADSYRDFVMKNSQKYKNTKNNLWFTGSHGFQYYMQKEGHKFLLHNDNSPKKGDFIIKARLPTPRRIGDDLVQRIELVETITYDGKIPIRTQNPEAHAGFYTYAGGLLPFSISNSKLEHFDIYYVKE